MSDQNGHVSRRGFLSSLAGAVAIAATGMPFRLVEDSAPKLLARHLSAYDISLDSYVHRIDAVVAEGGVYVKQYGVDFICDEHPTPEKLQPALTVLANEIEYLHGVRFDIEIRHGQFDLPKVGASV